MVCIYYVPIIFWAVLIIERKLSAFNDAPPITPPSTLLRDSISKALFSFKLPPYKTST
jgi:hypothetical protein